MTVRERQAITTADGVADAWLCRPAGSGAWPGVLFFMDGLGVRPTLIDMASRLAGQGYVVLLPDLFYRAGSRVPVDAAVALNDPQQMAQLHKLYLSLDASLVMRDTRAYLEHLFAAPCVAGRKAGCVGYCMGGGFALLAAGRYPQQIAAAACVHGAGLASDKTDSPHASVHHARGRLYIGVAETDPWLAEGEMERLQGALAAARIDYQMETYARTHHGFAVEDLPVYDRVAAERHWQRLLDLFRGALAVA
jgi:carboxymethylenebutenolidase